MVKLYVLAGVVAVVGLTVAWLAYRTGSPLLGNLVFFLIAVQLAIGICAALLRRRLKARQGLRQWQNAPRDRA
jgi:drug/metabolite transporter (DMT)-like permease